MNKLKWYSSKIWNQDEYEKIKSIHQSDLYNYLTGKKTVDYGVYKAVLRSVITKNNSMDICFLELNTKKYSISADVLLTNTRKKILETRGIPVYMAIRRFIRILNQKNGENRTQLKADIAVKKIHDIYPDTSKISNLSDLIKFIINHPSFTDLSERKIWCKVIKTYLRNVTKILNSSTDDNIVAELEHSLKK